MLTIAHPCASGTMSSTAPLRANGLRLSSERNKRVLPPMWGWNAVTSVAGSALAASIAIWSGFTLSMLAGAGCYLLVAGAAFMLARRA